MGKGKYQKPEGHPKNLKNGNQQAGETSSPTSMGMAFEKALQEGAGRIIYKNTGSANPPPIKKPFTSKCPKQAQTTPQPPKEVQTSALPSRLVEDSVPPSRRGQTTLQHTKQVKTTSPPPKPATKVDPAPPLIKWTRVGAETIKIKPSQSNQRVNPPGETAPSRPDLTPELGIRVQFHGGIPAETRDLVIGFDFGTSCTKIVIQDTAQQKAYAVPFGQLGCAQNPYLLPAKIYVRPAATLSLAREGQEFRDLKINLIQKTEKSIYRALREFSDISAKHLAVGYVGLVFREALRWFGTTHEQIYKRVKIQWQINIGLPARSYDDQGLCRLFRKVALAGWNLSVKAGEIPLSSLRTAFEEAEKIIDEKFLDPNQRCDSVLHPDSVQAMPEVVAEVAGFVRSPMRKTGMYLLVDAGASTLDASTFILHEREGEDIYPLLAADIRPLGANKLHLRRIQHVAESVENFLGEIEVHGNENAPIPALGKYMPQITGLDTVDNAFTDECSHSIASVVALTKAKRNPLAPEWNTGLPVFFCGGGAGLPFYSKAASAAAVRLRSMNIQGFEKKSLPKPVNLDAPGLLNEHYHRLAVAYGLSFSFLDIGKIIPQHQLEDMEKEMQELDSERLYVGKEMV